MNPKLKSAVVEALASGPQTYAEIAARVGVSVESTEQAVRWLRDAGLALRAGSRRDTPGSGSGRALWALAPGAAISDGAIENYHRKESAEDRFWRRVDRNGPVVIPDSPCWLWSGSTLVDTGYGQFFFRGKNEGAHRVSWRIAGGDIPAGLNVLHRCDVRSCVNPAHLFLGTQQDNVKDCAAKGRANTARGDANGSRKHPERLSRGEAHRNAKVTREIAREVRRRFATGETQASIGRAFSLSTNTVHAIVHNLRWVENE